MYLHTIPPTTGTTQHLYDIYILNYIIISILYIYK